MSSFSELGLKQELLEGVERLGFTTPTKVQEIAIPTILDSSQDLIALAQTGTGKTGAFGLPLLQKIDPDVNDVQAIVLSPTRELAIQIAKDLKAFAKKLKGVKTVAVYGGSEIRTQIKALDNGCQVVVGTPGRMLDLIKRRKLRVENIHTLVLDEADEMLNMGFQEDLDAILADTPEGKQTLLFSATMPKQMSSITKKYMHNPAEIEVGERNSGSKDVEHQYYVVKASNRFETLKRLVDLHPSMYGIIFCRTRNETMDISTWLSRDGYDVDVLNGDLSQNQRDQVMNRFRSKDLKILVATDVAARGLDVNNLSHIINYNLPDDLEVYIHRSGRTGRAGNKGICMSIVSPREQSRIRRLENMASQPFIKSEVPTGEQVCSKRLLHGLERVQKEAVHPERIQPFLPIAMEALKELSKEQIIERFLSLEFHNLLEYYEGSSDLNAQGDGGGDRGKRRSSSRRGDRRSGGGRSNSEGGGGRSGRRNDSRGGSRGSGAGSRGDSGPRGGGGSRRKSGGGGGSRRKSEGGGYKGKGSSGGGKARRS
jgi:ATP-dependent RNA helicase DeaD